MNNTYETKDIWIASTLATLGFPAQVEKIDDNKYIFVFEDSQELKETINKYIRNTLLVDPSVLQTAYKMLKKQIFN